NIIVKSAIYLDPRFQSTLSEENRSEAKFHLKKLWNSININKNRDMEKFTETISSSDTSSDELDEFINEISVKNTIKTNNISKDVNIAALLESFNNIPRMNHAMSILDFWEKKKFESP
ncbi:hypothetical protein CBL_21486, partial [Carabus blaptoides fortunei]